MEIVSFSAQDVEKHRDKICMLLEYSMKKSMFFHLPADYCEKKVSDLIHYLMEQCAYFWAAMDHDDVVGILWACELEKLGERSFHILYFSVAAHMQSTGIGTKLLKVAEQQAVQLQIPYLELNVTAENEQAVRFYQNRSFGITRLMMRKNIM